MNEDAETPPAALVVVAGLFFLGGFWAIIEMLFLISKGHVYINFGAIGVFIGPGLLRRSRAWRTCGMVLLGLGLVIVSVVTIFFFTHGGPLELSFFGRKVGQTSPLSGVAAGGLVLAFLLWMWHVLTRSDVRAYFDFAPESEPDLDPDA